MIEIRITITATTLTIGSWFGREKLLKIQIGSVSSPAPIVNVVTMISSNERAKASSAPATSAVRRFGKRDQAEGLPGSAPRSADASSNEVETPQPRDHVVVDDDDAEGRMADDDREQARSMPRTWVKVELSAIPVTIPGSAIGRITRNEIVSRPKKR